MPVDQLGGIADAADIEVSDRELAMARQLIESLAADFQPERHRDTYREQVLELIERKAAGEEEVVPVAAAPSATKVVDLMAALEASVREAKAARARHPAAAPTTAEEAPAADADEDVEQPDAEPVPARGGPSRRPAGGKKAAATATTKAPATKAASTTTTTKAAPARRRKSA